MSLGNANEGLVRLKLLVFLEIRRNNSTEVCVDVVVKVIFEDCNFGFR